MGYLLSNMVPILMITKAATLEQDDCERIGLHLELSK